MSEITAKVKNPIDDRISQCDIFQDVEIVEGLKLNGAIMELRTITFPYIICLNQDCDLLSDVRDKTSSKSTNKNCRLLHLAVAPLFNADSFKEGTHWGELFDVSDSVTEKSTQWRKIVNNEDPRYHFLRFNNESHLPDMVIDFKHFFTISTDLLYEKLPQRICSMDVLYREKICQRFAFFQSRIGLPD